MSGTWVGCGAPGWTLHPTPQLAPRGAGEKVAVVGSPFYNQESWVVVKAVRNTRLHCCHPCPVAGKQLCAGPSTPFCSQEPAVAVWFSCTELFPPGRFPISLARSGWCLPLSLSSHLQGAPVVSQDLKKVKSLRWVLWLLKYSELLGGLRREDAEPGVWD